jgi:SAM-dependent methyltransferase
MAFLKSDYFYQNDRINLSNAVNKYSHYITGRTLDVGAGPNQRYAFPRSTKYLRMDIPSALGAEKMDLIGYAEAIPAEAASFDAIVCTQTLVDIFEPVKAFKEFDRVLKHGGHLLLTTPFLLDRQDSEHQSWHPTDHALRRLCEENHFKVLVLEGCGGFYSAMFQLVSRYLLRRYRLKQSAVSRVYSALFASVGRLSIWLDGRQSAEMKKHYTDNWILVAKKI